MHLKGVFQLQQRVGEQLRQAKFSAWQWPATRVPCAEEIRIGVENAGRAALKHSLDEQSQGRPWFGRIDDLYAKSMACRFGQDRSSVAFAPHSPKKRSAGPDFEHSVID